MKKLTQILCTLVLSVALSGLVQAQETAKTAPTKMKKKFLSSAKSYNSPIAYTDT